jgi:hypothetical protein
MSDCTDDCVYLSHARQGGRRGPWEQHAAAEPGRRGDDRCPSNHPRAEFLHLHLHPRLHGFRTA